MKVFYQRNLPHFVPPGAVLFVTFRLKGSIAPEIIREFQEEHIQALNRIGDFPPPDTRLPWSPHRKCHPPARHPNHEALIAAYKRYFGKVDTHLDSTLFGPHHLKNEALAEVVIAKLKEFDERFYSLVAYTVMSNHVHALFDTYCQIRHLPPDVEITEANYVPYEKFMNLIKGASGFFCNRLLGITGNFWQHESFDHCVRSETEFFKIIFYILNNPVKAGLVRHWKDFPLTYIKESYLPLFDEATASWV